MGIMALRARFGRNALAYADRTFDIVRVSARVGAIAQQARREA